jgi:D-alanine-D-alanine ligase
MMKERGRVAVLMGGPSEEHDVSLRSGQGIVEALRRRGWAAEPLAIPKTAGVEEACAWTREALRRLAPDVAFIALHGAFGEDGTIQELCDALPLPYTGSTAATSRLGIDKAAAKRRFAAAGLAIPRGHVVDLAVRPLRLGRRAFPLVVKPIGQGSSLGVSIVEREAQLPDALTLARRYGSRVLLEEFVAGRELTVGVVGEEPLPVVEIRTTHAFFDFAAKYTAGMTEYLVPAPLPASVEADVKAAGLRAHQALGCRHLSRADMILRDDGVPAILEVNTIPGFTPTSLLPKAAACAGISYDDLCERLVMMALQERAPAMASPVAKSYWMS